MEGEYKVSGYRWVNLAIYTLVTFAAGMGFLAMAPLLEIMAQRWTVGFGAASLFMSVIGLGQVFLSIPTGWASGKIGYKVPVALGASLLALGFVLRGTAGSYGSFMLYTIIAGLGWGIIWAPVGTLAATWFPGREIGLANSLWPIGFLAGQAVGSLTSIPFMINFGWGTMWLIYGIIAVAVAAIAWLFLRPKPQVPPEPRPPFPPSGIIQGLKETLNRTNIALQYTVMASVGGLAVTPAIVPPMLIAKGVAPPTAGVAGGMALVGGMLGSIIVPSLAFAKHKTRLTILICAVVAPICFIGMFFAPVAAGSATLVFVLSLLFGFFMAPVLGISMGVGQMQPGVHPGNAGILAGMFLTSIGIGAALFPALMGGMVEAAGPMAGAWLLTALAAVSIIVLALFVPEPEVRHGPPQGAESKPPSGAPAGSPAEPSG